MSVARESKEVTRPLKVLEGLIKEKLKLADEAAEEARRPYDEEVGSLLLEAQSHFDTLSEYYGWATKKFGKSQETIRRYVAYAAEGGSKSFKNITDFAQTPKSQGGLGHQPRSRLYPWTEPVSDVAERARREAFRLAQEDALTRAQEREAERKLALRLIDIGYKVLAKELHPDKLHGDRDAMARLNRVKEKLRHCI